MAIMFRLQCYCWLNLNVYDDVELRCQYCINGNTSDIGRKGKLLWRLKMFKGLPLGYDIIAHLWQLTEKCNALVLLACP
jgi:hypothetical protein